MRRWLKSMFAVGRPLGAMLGVIGFFTLLDFVLHGGDATFWRADETSVRPSASP